MIRGFVLRWRARHRVRALLAVAAVALGVTAFVSSTAGALLVAFLGAARWVLSLGARALAPLLATAGGVPGRLAADELRRRPRRAALPAAALAVGLALVPENTGVVKTLSEETVEGREARIAGDLFVSSGRAVVGLAAHTLLEESLGAELAQVPGVERAVGVRFRYLPWRGTRVFLRGLDGEPYGGMARLTIRGGPRDEVLAAVARGDSCLASENFAAFHGVRAGDEIALPGASGEFRLRIAGTFTDSSWARGSRRGRSGRMPGPRRSVLRPAARGGDSIASCLRTRA